MVKNIIKELDMKLLTCLLRNRYKEIIISLISTHVNKNTFLK